jgi:CheY-like chemotaxis protein
MHAAFAKGPLAGIQVLVVDDHPQSAKLVAVLLAGVGGEVRVVGSAEDAIALLDEFLPRVIVLDLVLPAMSGLLLAQRLRANPITEDAILVAVTIFSGPETERAVHRAGCDAHVSKPIDPLAFADQVVALVQARL